MDTEEYSNIGPVCPNCKRQYIDDGEWHTIKEFDCDECGKVFTVEPEYSVDWFTRLKEENAPTLK